MSEVWFSFVQRRHITVDPECLYTVLDDRKDIRLRCGLFNIAPVVQKRGGARGPMEPKRAALTYFKRETMACFVIFFYFCGSQHRSCGTLQAEDLTVEGGGTVGHTCCFLPGP